MSIRPLLGGCVWKAGPCPEGCKSILSWQKTNLSGILFFFFFSTKESCVLQCEPELQQGGGSCKSSSRLERFPLSLLELHRDRAPRCQELKHHHHRIMQTWCCCNLLRDTGNLPPGRGGRQGKPWKSFLVTKTMLYCKVRRGLSLLSRLTSHLQRLADLIRAERDYQVVKLFASYWAVMNEGFCSAQPGWTLLGVIRVGKGCEGPAFLGHG